MLSFLFRGFATKAAAGVTKNKKDSAGKRLGIKAFGGHEIGYNKILVRQRGFKWHPGCNVFVGRDHTLHSATEGVVKHEYNEKINRTLIHVVPWKIPQRPKLQKPFCYHPELFPDKAINNPQPGNYEIKLRKVKAPKPKINQGILLAERKY